MLKIITYLLPALLKLLKPEILREGIDKLLDFLEEKVKASDNKLDDAIVLPLIKVIREAVKIQ